jgi:hypothetical protein
MGRLDDLIRQGSKEREASEVEAIVGGSNGRDNAAGRGKFSAACAEAAAETAAAELDQARQLIMSDPKIVDNGLEGEFYGRFPNANIVELRALVGTAKAVLHPPPTFDDVPEAKPGRFVRFRPRPGW